MIKSIKKKLTNNDTGSNGSHQAGLHFPKENDFLSFFPSLNSTTYNPRENLVFRDEDEIEWKFVYIHYNNKIVENPETGKYGTRNEYRLTHMTKYFRTKKLSASDSIIFSKDQNGNFLVNFKKSNPSSLINSDKIWEVEFI